MKQDPKVSELANQQLSDIATLRNTLAFERYFRARLRSRQQDRLDSFLKDDPEKCDAVRREVLRRLVLEYGEILEMMDTDERTAKRLIMGAPA